MLSPLPRIMEDLTQHFNALGLPAEHHIIPGFDGYQSVTGGASGDVYYLQVRLGDAHQKPGYSACAIVQVFDPANPNLALITLIERNDETGLMSKSVPVYNRTIDHAFSYHFLPTMHTAFNECDPTGQNRGLLVQLYNARITLADLAPASIATIKLMSRFKRDGQLAQIAVDFDDPLTVLIARAVGPLAANHDVHYLSRTVNPSAVRVPIRDASGNVQLIDNLSSALDEGFSIAYRYLREHRARNPDLNSVSQALRNNPSTKSL